MKFKTGPLFILMFAAVILILPALSYAQSTENNLLKFDADFRDEIGHMLIQQSDGAGGESDADSIHSVIIITDDGQEDQVEQFLQGLDAQNIFKSNSLDFLTADMPVNRLLELSEHDFIYKIGDGQKELFSQAHEGSNVIGLTMAQAKTLINADNIPSSSYPYTGRGIVVGLIDEPVDFTHPDLQNKNAGKKFCNARVCDLDSTDDSNHGTGIAGVIASNSNDDTRDGIALNSRIFSISLIGADSISENTGKTGHFARALDEILNNNIKISLSSRSDNESFGCHDYSALTIVIDRAVEQGLSFSMAIGNHGTNSGSSIQNLSCGFNYINVGSLEQNRIISEDSSKGPAQFVIPAGDTGRIKPEIVSAGEDIDIAIVARERMSENSNYVVEGGSSFANGFVAGASALIHEKMPNYNSLQIKSALLLGADWQASVPATADDYDRKVSGVYNTMNQYGFGILDVKKSLDYANNNRYPNILHDTSNVAFGSNTYRIYAQQDDQVKVLLSWFIHPRGTVLSPILPLTVSNIPFQSQFHNYDLKIAYPDGTRRQSTSDIQNNEFIVFEAPETGLYTITVSSDERVITTPNEPYVLASTHGIDKFPYDFVPPDDCDPGEICNIDDGNNNNGGNNNNIGTNQRPVISIAPIAQNQRSGATIQLDASGTTDDGNSLTFQWIPLRNALNIDIRLKDDNSAIASFDIPYVDRERSADISFLVNVEDGEHRVEEIVDLTVILTPQPPIDVPERHRTPGFAQTIFLDEQWENRNNWKRTTDWVSTRSIQPLPVDTNNIVVSIDECNEGDLCELQIKEEIELYTYDGADVTFWVWLGDEIRDSDSFETEVAMFQVWQPNVWRDKYMITVDEIQRDRWFPVTINMDEFARGAFLFRFVPMIANDDSIIQLDAIRIIIKTIDNTRPVISGVPDDIVLGAPNPRVISYDLPTATDDMDGTVDVMCDPPSGILHSFGTTRVRCTAMDTAENIARASFTITLNEELAPLEITTPDDLIVEAEALLTVLDIGNATTNRDAVITNDAPVSFPLGNTTITWTATDSAGNTVTDTQVITVQDTTAPEFDVIPQDGRLETPLRTASLDYLVPVATDLVDEQVDVSCIPQIGTQVSLGNTTVTCTATDDFDNSSIVTFDVMVVLVNPPPTVKNVIQKFNIVVDDTARLFLDTKFSDDNPLTYTTMIANSTVVSVQIQNNVAIMTGLAAGSTSITACANDGINELVCQDYNVTVTGIDFTVTVPDDLTAEATASLTAVDLGNATTNRDAVITNDAPDSFPLGNTTITWTATDSAGNTVTDTQIITVQDTTPPVIDVPDDITARTDNVSYTVHYDFTVTDTVDDDVFIHCNSPSGLGFYIGAHNVRCAAVDSSGNRATGSFNIIIERITPIPNDSALLWNNFERSVSLGDFDRTGDIVRARVTDSGIETIQRHFFPTIDDNGSRVVHFRECEDTCTMTLVSPLTSPQDSVMLEFDKFQSDNRSTGMLRLDISTDREDWETLQLYQGAEFKTGAWTHEQFVLDSGTYFRFVSDTSGLFYPQFIDNILVTEIP